MNAIVAPDLLSNVESSDFIERSDGSAELAVSPQLSCRYSPNEATLWSRWSPRGIPSFNMALLRDLERGSQTIEGYFSESRATRPLQYIVLQSGIDGVFNLGGDLGYIQRMIACQDRAGLTEYARAAINVQHRNFTAHGLHNVTTVALLEGDALGGGLECALSCDVVIAEKHVKAGFPEILFNMFPGMGGISFLSRRVPRSLVDEMTRSGRQYTALELLEHGVVDQVVETGEGMAAVERLRSKREHQASAHSAMNAVDRMIRPVTLQELHEVVRLWVDCALHLSPRSVEWMQRLYQRQLSVFGRPLAAAVAESPRQAAALAA